MILNDLQNKNLISPPSWLPNNTAYLVQMGSIAYGVSGNSSDTDIYGFVVPPKTTIFPHLNGEIFGFGRQKKKFEVWQQHHINDPGSKKEYDFSVYSIVKFFQLVMENNPNMLDALFVPKRCIIHNTPIAEMIREKRNIFLHKGCWHKFKGYAFSQIQKMKSKNHKYLKELMIMEEELNIPHNTTLEDAELLFKEHKEYVGLYHKMCDASNRSERCKINGYDTKFAYHIIRLLEECEQILSEENLTLDEKGRREKMKAIRRGEWSIEQIEDYFDRKEKHLEDLYHSSKLPYKPDEEKIKELLLSCLEHHYGNLDNAIVQDDQAVRALRAISEIIDKNRGAF